MDEQVNFVPSGLPCKRDCFCEVLIRGDRHCVTFIVHVAECVSGHTEFTIFKSCCTTNGINLGSQLSRYRRNEFTDSTRCDDLNPMDTTTGCLELEWKGHIFDRH